MLVAVCLLSISDIHRETRWGHQRSGWALAVELVILEGSFATFSVIPSGATSSDGWTGMVAITRNATRCTY